LAKDKEKTTDSGGGAKPSLMSVLLPVLLLTLIAAGGGFAVGTLLAAAPNLASAGMGTEVAAEAHVAGPADKTGASGHAASGGIVRQLAPIITNLSSPKDIWIRIEASIIISPEAQAEQDTIAVKSSDQILALLRTVTLAQIEGPSGFLHFREDINDLVRENSGHKVSQVLISSMVVE
jgi:flagellar protein FliL